MKANNNLLTSSFWLLQNQVPGEAFPTTSEDLAGFWDMVMLQVVQVNDIFEQLDRSRKSQWQEVNPYSNLISAIRDLAVY